MFQMALRRDVRARQYKIQPQTPPGGVPQAPHPLDAKSPTVDPSSVSAIAAASSPPARIHPRATDHGPPQLRLLPVTQA